GRVRSIGDEVVLAGQQRFQLARERGVVGVLVVEIVACGFVAHADANYARSVGNGSTSSMWLAPVASMTSRSKPKATPQQSGRPASSAASRRSSGACTGR